ncbi:MAG: hypothetical protein ACO3A4_03455 [Silvanigrellaceae bacterium]
MRSVFQVVATMVLANAAVAYGADAKSAVSAAKKGANATVEDAKAKAADVAKGAQTQATEVKATATDAAKDSTKQANASQPAAQPAATPASEVKEAAKEAMASQPEDKSELAGARKSLIIPESAVLPENVLRFRAVYAAASSAKGYDGAANKVETGLKITANVTTAVFEYGITEKISAQLLIPYRLDGKASVSDKDKFSSTVIRPGFEANYGAATNLAATSIKGLVALNQVPGLSALYAANQNAPQAIDLGALATQYAAANPTNTAAQGLPLLLAGVSIPAGANVKDFIDNKLRGAIADTRVAAAYDDAKKSVEETKFQKGLGDVEMGAKYALSTVKEPWFDGVPFYTSVAAGIRLNSSNFSEATKKDEIPVGRGTLDGAIRLNADYEAINGVQLQLENQTEIMLSKGKAWTASEADKGEEKDLERKGARQVGYSKLMVAPGTWIPAVDFLMLNARYSWNNDSTSKLGDEETVGSVGRSAQVGVSFDGLKMKLPVQLDYDYVMAARGRSVDSAFDAHVATLKLFYKF